MADAEETEKKTIRRVFTNVFVRDLVEKKVLLGFKKRGLGIDKWNGLGRKPEENESIAKCAKREVEEESGLEVEQPKYVGYIEYQILSRMHETLEVYVFVTDSFKGEIRECDEIRPEWFDIDKLPYDKMWKDNYLWHQLLFENKKFKAYFLYHGDEETVIDYFIEQTENLE